MVGLVGGSWFGVIGFGWFFLGKILWGGVLGHKYLRHFQIKNFLPWFLS